MQPKLFIKAALALAYAFLALASSSAYAQKACWWMNSTPPYNWIKNGGMPASNEAACKNLDSCSPGGGKASGGGCYRWGTDEEVNPPPKACWWMNSTPPYNWIKNGGMPAKTEAECLRLDSCSPKGGKASGGGCYIWATDEEVKKATTPPPPPPKFCYWMESRPPYAWIKNGGIPAKTEAECVKLDSCTPQGGKASGGGCYKWATEAEMKTPPPAPKITVKKSIYGENCSNVNKAKMDIAKFVGDACNGKVSCLYVIDAFKVVGDPAPNCPKELVTTYSCGGADKTHKLDKEAHGKGVSLDCAK